MGVLNTSLLLVTLFLALPAGSQANTQYVFNFENDLEGWSSSRDSWRWADESILQGNTIPSGYYKGFAVMDKKFTSGELYTTYFTASQGGNFTMKFYLRSQYHLSNTFKVYTKTRYNIVKLFLDLKEYSMPTTNSWTIVQKELPAEPQDIMFEILCYNGDKAPADHLRDHDPPQHNPPQHNPPQNLHKPPQNLHNPPQNLHNPPQNLHNPPQNLHNPPQNLHNPPQNLHNPPQNLHNPPQNLHNPPQNLHNPPQNLHNPPQNLHNPPQNLHNPPQNLHNPPQNLHNPPQNLHNPPQNLHNPPQNLHNPPQNLHNPPQNLHNPPQNLHNPPQNLHNPPQNLHNPPQNLHNPPQNLHNPTTEPPQSTTEPPQSTTAAPTTELPTTAATPTARPMTTVPTIEPSTTTAPTTAPPTTAPPTTAAPGGPITFNFESGMEGWSLVHMNEGAFRRVHFEDAAHRVGPPPDGPQVLQVFADNVQTGTVVARSPRLQATKDEMMIVIRFWMDGSQDFPAQLKLRRQFSYDVFEEEPVVNLDAFGDQINNVWFKYTKYKKLEEGETFYLFIEASLGGDMKNSVAVSSIQLDGVKIIEDNEPMLFDFEGGLTGWTAGKNDGGIWELTTWEKLDPSLNVPKPITGEKFLIASRSSIYSGTITLESPIMEVSQGTNQLLKFQFYLRGTVTYPVVLRIRKKTPDGTYDDLPFIDLRKYGNVDYQQWMRLEHEIEIPVNPEDTQYQLVVEVDLGSNLGNVVALDDIQVTQIRRR
ncbi:hypothetical protein O3P69_016587 [Scylla paramamosain]|uniref:MAM domain-containing protein n=1 Tax=Scylla paramamosain TaxID=85552 RepID=A0AAW0SX80_SCYPA